MCTVCGHPTTTNWEYMESRYDSYTFPYSTLGIPVLYTETVLPDVQPRRNATAGGTILIGGDPQMTASHWSQKQIF